MARKKEEGESEAGRGRGRVHGRGRVKGRARARENPLNETSWCRGPVRGLATSKAALRAALQRGGCAAVPLAGSSRIREP